MVGLVVVLCTVPFWVAEAMKLPFSKTSYSMFGIPCE